MGGVTYSDPACTFARHAQRPDRTRSTVYGARRSRVLLVAIARYSSAARPSRQLVTRARQGARRPVAGQGAAGRTGGIAARRRPAREPAGAAETDRQPGKVDRVLDPSAVFVERRTGRVHQSPCRGPSACPGAGPVGRGGRDRRSADRAPATGALLVPSGRNITQMLAAQVAPVSSRHRPDVTQSLQQEKR
jgi:hypothetical protein